MDRQFDKLSISTSGLLGDRRSQPQHFQTHHYQQQQLPHHPVRQPQHPASVYVTAEQQPEEPPRQRTGRIRQARSSTWGGGADQPANGHHQPPSSAELDETVDLRRRAPSQAESPRTPRTPAGGGSPRYSAAAGQDSNSADPYHLAAISPRGAASVPHSYQRRDRNPSTSSSNGGGGLMVTEDDFRQARDVGNHSTMQQQQQQPPPPKVLGPDDISTRLLQKYKTDSLRVEAANEDRLRQRQQQHPPQPSGLSKSHDGFVVPRRLPPISGGQTAAVRDDHGVDDRDDDASDDDEDGIECDMGDVRQQESETRQSKHRHQRRHQSRHEVDDQQQNVGHKGRTRTN